MSCSSSETIPKLYESLSLGDIDKLQNRFQRQKSGGLSYEKFRVLVRRFGIVYSDDAFRNVCLRIDLDRDNVIKWREFIAYFILELQNDDNMKARLSIIQPIAKPANVLSLVQRSRVVRVMFSLGDNEAGSYVTTTSFGDFNVWTSNWKLEMSRRVGEFLLTNSADKAQSNSTTGQMKFPIHRHRQSNYRTSIKSRIVQKL